MNEKKITELISLWLNDNISPEQLSELDIALQKDVQVQQLFLEHMSVHAELSNVGTTDNCFESLNKAGSQGCAEEVSCSRSNDMNANGIGSRYTLLSSNKGKFTLALAAVLLLTIGFWKGFGAWNENSSPFQQLSSTGDAASSLSFLDSIIPSSNETSWYIEGTKESNVGSISTGDVLRVSSGKLKLKYSNGIEIMLHSPAAYQVLSEMKARMLVGRLTATVSEEGKGFSVITPQATVIDLGTEFGVEVDNDGATDVVVFKGSVDVDYHKNQTAQDNVRRLVMGEAVRLDAVGTTSRIISVDQRDYYSKNDVIAETPVVISDVRDNIERDAGSMDYYEIVHQGMQEDALAFVDRIAHEWNGIDSKGMPRYLLGADYVKTFNADKYDQNIEVGVKVAVPCRFYVLFDDRLRIPSWLSKDFEDTGDDIGIDNGPFFSNGEWHNKGPSGVGPGESVKDIFSVWVKEIPVPGVYKLGSTETYQGSTLANMYGIAATPLEAP